MSKGINFLMPGVGEKILSLVLRKENLCKVFYFFSSFDTFFPLSSSALTVLEKDCQV